MRPCVRVLGLSLALLCAAHSAHARYASAVVQEELLSEQEGGDGALWVHQEDALQEMRHGGPGQTSERSSFHPFNWLLSHLHGGAQHHGHPVSLRVSEVHEDMQQDQMIKLAPAYFKERVTEGGDNSDSYTDGAISDEEAELLLKATNHHLQPSAEQQQGETGDYDEAGGDWIRAYDSEYQDIPAQLRAALAANGQAGEPEATSQHADLEELEAQELHQDLDEIMRDSLLHNLATEVGAMSGSHAHSHAHARSRAHGHTHGRAYIRTSYSRDSSDGDAVTESDDDDEQGGETEMMVVYTSEDPRDDDDVYGLQRHTGPFSVITVHPLSSLSNLVSNMLSWGQQHFPLTMVHPIDAYNHACAEHDLIMSVDDYDSGSSTASKHAQVPGSQGKLFSSSTSAVSHADAAAAVSQPQVEQPASSEGSSWWSWWQAFMATKNGQLLQLVCLLVATAGMLVGFVSTLISLRRVMRSRELLVPFTIQHENGVQHGYMVLGEEELAAAGLGMEAGDKAWPRSDAWKALDEEKQAAQASWDAQSQGDHKKDQA